MAWQPIISFYYAKDLIQAHVHAKQMVYPWAPAPKFAVILL